MGAINQKKVDLEGEWVATHVLMGFEVSVKEVALTPPTAKRAGALVRINDPVFHPGRPLALW